MKLSFFPKLALDGIRTNRRLVLPYILSGAVLVTMTYILFFLASSEMLEHMKGGGVLGYMLPIGIVVVSVFAVIFMFYTNSFIIRQRYREFGLYNVLGMDKHNLGRLMLWENLIAACLAIGPGLIAGILLSKFAELGMVNLLKETVNYTLYIDFGSVGKTALLFLGIFALLLINSVIKVRKSDPLELLRSENVGEKAPKANWITTGLGIILLGVAYSIALSIKHPLEALFWFMIAVILVIIATYLLFISGSVALCRLLQKNKAYYYKPNHFVSVSSMTYRMKRNGAGLASICVLITIVLVMLSSTISLYSGAEVTLRENYPQDIALGVTLPDMEHFNEGSFSAMRRTVSDLVDDQIDVHESHAIELAGLLTGDQFLADQQAHSTLDLSVLQNLCYLHILSQDDYTRLTGETLTLAGDECLISCYRTSFSADRIEIEGCAALKVKGEAVKIQLPTYLMQQIVPCVTLVVRDAVALTKPLQNMQNNVGDSVLEPKWYYSFDVSGGAEAEMAAYTAIKKNMDKIVIPNENGGYSYQLGCRESDRQGFYALYGALFFIGILLSVVFIFAAVLIIYYKQISEGYEDQKRFSVMQKVGMTKAEIRRSVNSQVLTVFFLPLLLSGVHLAFAFPIIWKLLQLFMFRNVHFMIGVTAAIFAVFALIYALVYKVTSNTYCAIVSGKKE